MSKIAAEAAKRILTFWESHAERGMSVDEWNEEVSSIIQSALAERELRIAKLETALRELIAYLDSMTDFDHQPEPLSKARAALATEGEKRESD